MPSMALLLLFARLLLCAVFLVAGVAKLTDLAGSRQAMRDFGVPHKLADVFGLLLPLAEIAVAVTLVLPLTAWWGAVGAVTLLLIFVAGIGYNLAQGRTPDCHCFGQLHSAPAGWSTLIRNLVLAGIAGLVVGFGRATPGPGLLYLLTSLTVTQRLELLGGVLLLLVLIAEGLLLMQIMTQQGRLLLRIEGLETRLGQAPSQPAARAPGLAVGTPAPAFSLSGLHGETMTLEALRAGSKPLLLLFTDPGCGPCTALLPEIGQWQRDHVTRMQVALLSRGTVEANRAKVTEPGVTQVLLQKDREVADAYQAYGTPSAVLVRQDGTIGSSVAQGADAIRALVSATLNGTVPMLAQNGQAAAAAPRPPAGLKIGEPAPDFSLPDLAGKTVKLSDFRGNPTLVLFWRPSCGFCARMLPDLKAWEANATNGAPKLLVVSTDSVADNQGMELRSTVLLDKSGMSVGSKFGAGGTPMGVLIDAEGKIASELAAGAPAVLELVGREQTQVRRA